MTRAIRPVDADGDGFRTISSALVRDLPVGVVVQSAEGTIVEANAAAERILGLTRDQMMGRTSVDPRWRSVRRDGTPFPGADHPSMRAIREGGIQRELMGVHKPDGSVTWIEIEARRVADQPESPVFACFVDVTAVLGYESRQFCDTGWKAVKCLPVNGVLLPLTTVLSMVLRDPCVMV
jgi:PAS domain S-box-containing protein